MKKLFLIALIAACFQVTTAQNSAKIDVELQQEMSLRDAGDLIRINIIMNQQYDQMEMRTKASVFPRKEAKRTFVVGELKRFSAETQQGVMDLLSTMPAVAEVQSYWIANFINCYADAETIEALSLHPDVLLIGFDKDVNVLPENEKPTPAEPTREITYNITKVQADQVWALGYEGEGVVVAVLDTGVNYNHNDLKSHMWEHPDFPYHGWNFVSNNNNPMDDYGHGTHCAGTVAGDGTAGSQTGIAPKAQIMAVKIIENAPISAWCSGIAFAVEYGAHVLSLSLGYTYLHTFDGTYADASLMLRNTMVNTLAAGVIASVAAGNEGDMQYSYPIPQNVRTPGNCPPPWLHPDQTTTGGTSAVVCVGATDSNDAAAYFTSKGPVTWQSIAGYNDYPYNPGMGLIRPDVCAPGVGIKSLSYSNVNGYTDMDGTSMATPCVAGVMALMLSKNIDLTPAEICEILETTAVHLPTSTSPKGNTFGSGRIDALAAVMAVPVGPIAIHEVAIDDSEGNNNGNANPSETIKFDMSLINESDNAVNGVSVTLTSSSEYVTITSDYAEFGNFAVGEIKTVEGAFTFELSSSAPAKKTLPFTALIETDDDAFPRSFTISAFDYELHLTATALDDASGNGDGILNPGETADILPTITNKGNEPAKGLTGFLTSSSDEITINSNTAGFGDMEPDQTNAAPYNVTLSASAVPGSVNIPFNLLVTDEDGRKSTFNFAYKDKCTVVFDLYDSYGDGWTGNVLHVAFSDGSPIQNLTINGNNSFATYSFAINAGVTVSLSWTSGSWTGECSFEIYYLDGDPIYAASGNPGYGTFFSWVVNCGGSAVNCDPITDLAITIDDNTAELTWNAPVGGTPTYYEIYHNLESLGTTTETHFSATVNNGNNEFCVYAVFNDCLMPQCITAYATLIECDPPTDLVYTVGPAGLVDISWDRPEDDANLTGYNVYINGVWVVTTTAEYYTFYAFAGEVEYYVCVTALHSMDGTGCESEMLCETINVTIHCDITVELTAASALDVIEIQLSWLPVLDGFTYNIYRDAELLIAVTDNAYTDTDVAPETTYCYTVTAVCAEALESEPSNEECLDIPVTGINEIDNQIKIYPNPTSGELTICDMRYEICDIAIFDVMGRTVLQSHIGNRTSHITFDLSNVPAGVYFLRVTTENGVIVRKVMKE
ncbi:MAG: S8 family serine peptidase [Bacteroidales bacterium]|nr:S8 family serine peptidase [Bacteroidales bacterium]